MITSVNETGGTLSRMVKLKSGGTLTLSASVDFWLYPSDRKFVFELIDKLEAYEQPADAEEG